MRGIFLVSCFLGGSALLAGCREENNSPRPATEDAARITSARQWGESRSALQKRELDRAAGPALPIPDDLPSRELVGTTRQIHQLIEASGNPARFESYTETVPAAGASCAWSPYREERSSWGVPRKSRTGNRTKVRSIK